MGPPDGWLRFHRAEKVYLEMGIILLVVMSRRLQYLLTWKGSSASCAKSSGWFSCSGMTSISGLSMVMDVATAAGLMQKTLMFFDVRFCINKPGLVVNC